MNNDIQTFTAEYVILPKPVYWCNLLKGQKFALNHYGFNSKEQRFEIYTKRTWIKCFLETHPQKIEYSIYKLINPLTAIVYPVTEHYYFTK